MTEHPELYLALKEATDRQSLIQDELERSIALCASSFQKDCKRPKLPWQRRRRLLMKR